MKSVSKGSRTSDIERMNRMFKIVRKKELNSAVTLMEIEAPFVAKKAKAGQFLSLIHISEPTRLALLSRMPSSA